MDVASRLPRRRPQFGFMHVMDVNGDGRNDVVTSHAHDYGVFWFEQLEGGKWAKRVIDESWSQAHALTVVDLNGDGRKDILTGKRYMAHNGRDPGEREPLGIYWYEQLWSADKKNFEWVRHMIDYGTRTGAGHADSRSRSRRRRRPRFCRRRQKRPFRLRKPHKNPLATITTDCCFTTLTVGFLHLVLQGITGS